MTTKPKSTPSLQLCGRAQSLVLVLLLPVGNFCKLREQLYIFATYELVFLLAFLTYTFIAVIEHRFFNGPSQILLPVQFCGKDLSFLLLLLPVGNFCKLLEQPYIFATCKLVFLLLSFLTYTFVAVIEY